MYDHPKDREGIGRMTSLVEAYFDAIIERLAQARSALAGDMTRAVEAIVTAARADRCVFVFGTGHSHMLAEETHYRAGGLAFVVPVLATATMLHEGSVASTAYERMEGVATQILSRYAIDPGDVLVVVSNSGVNAAPLEAARLGRERGATVIALTSVAYSTSTAKGRTRLIDLADIVLDNGAPAGDAMLDVTGSALKVGPASTVVGASILNAVLAEVAGRLAGEGEAPIYLSANMPGAKEINEKLIARYRSRNPHL